jgi:hypothetical protein
MMNTIPVISIVWLSARMESDSFQQVVKSTSGMLIRTRTPQPYPAGYSVAYSPNRDIIAYSGKENLLRLWNVQNNTEAGIFEVPRNTLSIYSIAFTP